MATSIPNIHPLENKRLNYSKLFRAVKDPCTAVLRELLLRYLPPEEFVQMCVPQYIIEYFAIRENVKSHFTYDSCDIFQLYIIMRSFAPLPPPTRGWGVMPTAQETTEGDDIERIRILSNHIFTHRIRTGISDQEFIKHWQMLYDVMFRMDKRLGSSFLLKLKIIEEDNIEKRMETLEGKYHELLHMHKFEQNVLNALDYMEYKTKQIHDTRSKELTLEHNCELCDFINFQICELDSFNDDKTDTRSKQLTVERNFELYDIYMQGGKMTNIQKSVLDSYKGDKTGKGNNTSPTRSESDRSNLKVLRFRSPIEYLDCEDYNIKRNKDHFQFCNLFCGTQLNTQKELDRRLKHALKILDAEQEEETAVTIDSALLSLSKCCKSSYVHLLLAYYMIQLDANTNSVDKYNTDNVHSAVQNGNVFLTILLMRNGEGVCMENENVLKFVIDIHKKKCQHGNIWDKNTKCEHAVIARYISYLIAFQYQRKLSDNYKYLKVWPGYKHQDEISSYQGLHLVVQCDRMREDSIPTVSNTSYIPLIWHNVYIVSTEGKYMNFKTQEHEDDENLKHEFNNFRPIDKQTAKMLFKCHRNLNIISISMLKSVGYGKNHTIIKKPCVTLYCDVKGIIPVGEGEFNASLPGYVLDIREGHFSFAADSERRSHQYHEHLKMGCNIGTKETFPSYGTLGGFVEHRGVTYFLTCAHVVFSIQELQRQSSGNKYCRKVVQPQDENRKKIGQVRSYRFPKNTDQRETSVDAALVEISSRMPVDGTFPDDDRMNLDNAGYTKLPTFRSGEIKTSFHGTERRNQVVKFGAKTGLTIGIINPHKDHVRIRNDEWLVTEVQQQRLITHKIQIFNQYEIVSLGNSPFALKGDSGSFVFMMKNNDQNQLQCIGMLIGLTSAGTALVTPILSILESLSLNKDSLKTFDSTAIVDRQRAIHDTPVPDNVMAALNEIVERIRNMEPRFLLIILSFGVFLLSVYSATSK